VSRRAAVLCDPRVHGWQPAGLKIRLVDAGCFASNSAGRDGRRTSSPPQFGHLNPSFDSAQAVQNVHSKVQMNASEDVGGRSVSQHSQPGLSSSIHSPLLSTLT
jgi:hypothetical protein